MSAATVAELLADLIEPAPPPSKAANSANREHPCGVAADSTLCESLRISANLAGPHASGCADSQTFAGIRRTENRPESEQRRGFSQDSQNSQGFPPTCTTGEAWTDADSAQFLDRRARLMRWGWAEPEAEKMAEQLVRRDREVDDRAACVECRHYRPGRCANHRRAGLHAPDLGRDLAVMLQRCPGHVAINATAEGTT